MCLYCLVYGVYLVHLHPQAGEARRGLHQLRPERGQAAGHPRHRGRGAAPGGRREEEERDQGQHGRRRHQDGRPLDCVRELLNLSWTGFVVNLSCYLN